MGMSMSDGERQALVAEVLELGESLFEDALEVHGNEQKDDEIVEVMEEIRGAKDEFFGALRMLLSVRE